MRFLIKLLLLLPALASATPKLPDKNPLENWLASTFGSLDRSQRFQLATHFPKLFPIRFVCQFRASQAQPIAVVNGDWIEAPAGGSITCPGKIEINVEKDSRLQLRQIGEVPLLHLEKGALAVDVELSPYFLETEGFEIALMGEKKRHRMELKKSAAEERLVCDLGAVTSRLDLHVFSGKRSIESVQCRLGVNLPSVNQTRYLHSGDSVLVENLSLPRKFWPSLQKRNNRAEAKISLIISIPPNQPLKEPFQLHWLVPAEYEKLQCSLYSQSEDGAEPLLLKSIELNGGSGEMSLEAAQRNASLSLLCENEKELISSNVILPPVEQDR